MVLVPEHPSCPWGHCDQVTRLVCAKTDAGHFLVRQPVKRIWRENFHNFCNWKPCDGISYLGGL